MNTPHSKHRNPPCSRQLTSYSSRLKVLCVSILSLSLWGCVTAHPPSAAVVDEDTPTPSPTFTFPSPIPSSTHTAEPTSTPTPNVLVGIGAVVYQDGFDTDESWELRETEIGGSSIYNSRLNLAVRQQHSFFFIRSPAPVVDNFYLEVSLRSEVCEEDDEFGVMFRLGPFYEHYRFSLTCEGLARVSRILEDGEIVLIPPTQTYAVFPGPGVENRLAVWASGPQFRFLINGTEVFTASDVELEEGGIGFFVRSRRSDQTTVSFDKLTLYELLPFPTSTPNPESDTNP